MIAFDLRCADGHVFETWFRDGGAYDSQVAAGDIVCPVCGSSKIAKAPMAPNLVRGAARETQRAGQAMRFLRALHDHVEKNFDDVGQRFPEEARKIHFGETEKRNIRGQATSHEARELTADGVEFATLPPIPSHDS